MNILTYLHIYICAKVKLNFREKQGKTGKKQKINWYYQGKNINPQGFYQLIQRKDRENYNKTV